VPWVLALFGVGMTVGTQIGGRLADRGVLRAVVIGFVATAVSLVLFALTGEWVVPALASLFLLGVTSQMLGLAFQTRLMDLAPGAASLGAALCHAGLNVANGAGAFLGGVVIDAGWGYLAPAWAGVVVTVLGLAMILAFGRQRVVHQPTDTTL
jgi:DHA1 family inner membrane transport protein